MEKLLTAEQKLGAFMKKLKTPAQRLEDFVIVAVHDHQGDWPGIRESVWWYVRDKPDLLVALFEPFKTQALQRVISRVAHSTRAGNQSLDVTQKHRNPGSGAASRNAMAAVGKIASLSILDTFIVNGQPIGDVTSREAKAWAVSRRRDARFVDLLTANLPLDGKIRVYRRPKDSQKLYEQAEKEEKA